MHSTPLTRLRRRLLLSSSLLMAGAAGPALAQAFQGTPTVANGSVTFNRTTPGVETITQSSPVAVINWSPTDTGTGGGPINFLPAGSTATYRNSPTSQLTNFTTVNRVLPSDPTRQVALNGTINSLIVGATGASTSGGQVWFYSPGGILIGSTGVINVGGLVLSADDPVISGGSVYSGTSNQASFVGAANSTSTVSVSAGATITASPTGGYVVLVGPRVVQSGTVRVNGQAAYVAGEQVSITFKTPGQLFDISVPVGSFVPTGSTDNTVLRHDGSTTGPASTGSSDPHAIYLVADPKNAAIRTLLQVNGQFGFDAAVGASIINGTIILSDGITSGGVGGFIDSGQVADVAITGAGTISSSVIAGLNQARNLDISTTSQSSLAFTGNVSLTTSNLASGTRPLPSISLNALGTGSLSIAGSLSAFAAVGGYTTQAGATVAGVGGTITVNVDSGASLSVASATSLSTGITGASAISTTSGGAGGNATGGNINIYSAGSVSLSTLDLNAGATGGRGFTVANNGGTGSGGIVGISSTGGTFRVAGATNLNVTGNGGTGSIGLGNGGTAQLNVTGGTASFGATTLAAGGIGSSGATGGNGYSGFVGVSIGGGSTTMASLAAYTDVGGGTGSTGNGGFAIGTIGGAVLNLTGGRLTVTGSALVQTSATGGAGVGGGNGAAGNAAVTVANGTLSAGSLAINAFGVGGAASTGGAGGNGTGGTASLIIAATGAATDRITAGAVNFSAVGNGGAAVSGAGGSGTGGSASIVGGAGVMTLGATGVTATASGGVGAIGGVGGAATGGNVLIQTVAGSITTASYSGSGAAFGGLGGAGAATGAAAGVGGAATGGTATALVQGGSLGLGTNFVLDTSANGGNGGQSPVGAGGVGGAAQGGTSTAAQAGGAFNSGTTSSITAAATGGTGGAGFTNAGSGGNAIGGAATVDSRSSAGAIALSGLALNVSANGGAGGSSTGTGTGGSGGSGAAGDAMLIATGALAATNTRINADGTGGAGGSGGGSTSATGTRAGGAGGAATGGLAYAASRGNLLRLSGTQLSITADAYGGAGGNAGTGGAGGAIGGIGGAATAGTGSAADNFRRGAYLIGQSGTIDFRGLMSATGAVRTAVVEAAATAGGGGTGLNGGGAGGVGRAGVAQVIATGGQIIGDRLNVFAFGYGGGGGAATAGGGGAGGAGGLGIGGTSLMSVEQAAASLTVNVALNSFSDGFGGGGGAGGSGVTRGGAGGLGGDGLAGVSQVQVLKGTLAVAALDTTSAQNTSGGAGGAGGNATGTQGVGGAGGNGGSSNANAVVLLAQGGTATMSDVRLWSYSQGGYGGVGGSGTTAGLAGIGGSATGGELRIEAGVSVIDGTPGSLTANKATFQFDLAGGTGSTAGSVSGGVGNLYASTAPVTLGSFTTTTISTGGDTFGQLTGATVGGATVNVVATNAPLTVTGNAVLRSTGLTTLRATGSGVLNTGAAIIAAGSATIDQSGATNPNSFVTGLLSAQVTGDFTATRTATIQSASGVNITAGGLISVGNVTSATDDINLLAADNITAGALSAGDTVSLQTSTGSVTSGSLAAGIVTGTEGYIGGVGIDAARAVSTGSISARGGVLIASRGAGVSTGAIASGDDALLVAATTISAGSITVLPTTGTVDFAGDGANVLLGGVASLPAFGSTFTASGVAALRASVNPTGGSINAGDISASGVLAASAGTTLTLGNLSNFARIDLSSVGDTRTGGFVAGTGAGRFGIVSGGAVTIAGDVLGAGIVDVAAQRNINVASIVSPSGTSIRLGANGSVLGRTLTAQTIKVTSGNLVNLGAVTSTAAPDGSATSRLAILARNGVSLTSATSNTNLELYAVTGSIGATSLSAPDTLIALSGGSIGASSIASGAPYLAGIATAKDKAFGRGLDPTAITDFRTVDPNLFSTGATTAAAAATRLYAVTPVAAPGSISAGTVQGNTIVASSATSIDLTAAGSFAPLLVTAPSVTLTINGDFTLPAGIQASDSLSITGTGAVTTGALTVGSSIDINAVNAISVGAVTMQATGGSLNLISSKGGVTTGDVRNADVYIQAQGDVNFASLLTDTNSEANIYTNGAVVGGDVRAAEIEIGAAKTVTLGNVSTNTAPDPEGAHTDGLAVLGVGDVKITSVTSRNRAELYSVNGTLDVGSINASELIVTLAGNGIRVGTATTPGVAYLAGFATTTTSAGANVFIDYGSYTGADLAGRGDVNLFEPSGTFAANSATLATVAPSTAAGAISVNALTAGSVVAASGTSVTLTAPGALVARTVTAPTVSLTSGGLLSITGSVTGGALTLASSDIAIGPRATLGSATTKSVALIANNAAVRLGGTTQGSGYTLDAAEAATISAGTVSIVAPGTGQAASTVTIDSVTTQGSLATGGASLISVQTQGDVNVVGKVEMVSAAATDTLAISAGGTLRLTTPSGGLRVTGAPTQTGVGPLAGNLRLSGGTVLVASDAAAADLAKATTIDARAARLAQADGPTDAAGYLQANTISLAGARAIYVQNSGTSALGAGLTAGPGGLTIAPLAVGAQGSSRPEVILYGRQQTAQGSFVTGAALIPATTVTGGAAALATGSSINGCLIASSGSCGTATPTPMTPEVPMAIANIADVVSAVVQATNGSSTKSTLSPPTITTAFLLDFTPLTSFADIDKPVTGIGNDDLLPDDFGRPSTERPRGDRPARSPQAAPSPVPRKTGNATPSPTVSDAGGGSDKAAIAIQSPGS